MPDNREIAALVWLGAAASWVLSQQKLRASIGDVFKAFLQPLIVIPLAAMFAWIGLELWVGARLALWNVTLAKSTLLWTLGSAAVLFFNCAQAASDPRFFRRTIVATIGVAVFVEFFMNLYVMSLPTELVLQFVIIVLSLLAAVGGIRPDHKPVKILCEVLLAAIGFALFIYTVRQVYLGWDGIDGRSLPLEFALPIWLTAGLLPFLYILSFYVVYDAAFRGINWATAGDRRPAVTLALPAGGGISAALSHGCGSEVHVELGQTRERGHVILRRERRDGDVSRRAATRAEGGARRTGADATLRRFA